MISKYIVDLRVEARLHLGRLRHLRRLGGDLPHHLILDLVAGEIADGNILNLITKFLQAGVMEEGEVRPTWQGTPHGGVLSPLLATIVLNYLDWRLEALGYKFVRYADDGAPGNVHLR